MYTSCLREAILIESTDSMKKNVLKNTQSHNNTILFYSNVSIFKVIIIIIKTLTLTTVGTFLRLSEPDVPLEDYSDLKLCCKHSILDSVLSRCSMTVSNILDIPPRTEFILVSNEPSESNGASISNIFRLTPAPAFFVVGVDCFFESDFDKMESPDFNSFVFGGRLLKCFPTAIADTGVTNRCFFVL